MSANSKRLLGLILGLVLVSCVLLFAVAAQKTSKKGGSVSVTGCLQKGDEANEFSLIDDDGKTYDLRRAMKVPNSMGLSTGINFQPTGGGKAAITGDFVLIGSEVNPVMQALRSNGIEITALHSHMLDEQPRLFFMHFWANDDAVKLAKGLRAALDKTNSQKGK